MRRGIQVSSAPYLKDSARSNLLFELSAVASALYPPPTVPDEEKARDPEKAAEWFAAQGYKVVKSG